MRVVEGVVMTRAEAAGRRRYHQDQDQHHEHPSDARHWFSVPFVSFQRPNKKKEQEEQQCRLGQQFTHQEATSTTGRRNSIQFNSFLIHFY